MPTIHDIEESDLMKNDMEILQNTKKEKVRASAATMLLSTMPTKIGKLTALAMMVQPVKATTGQEKEENGQMFFYLLITMTAILAIGMEKIMKMLLNYGYYKIMDFLYPDRRLVYGCVKEEPPEDHVQKKRKVKVEPLSEGHIDLDDVDAFTEDTAAGWKAMYYRTAHMHNSYYHRAEKTMEEKDHRIRQLEMEWDELALRKARAEDDLEDAQDFARRMEQDRALKEQTAETKHEDYVDAVKKYQDMVDRNRAYEVELVSLRRDVRQLEQERDKAVKDVRDCNGRIRYLNDRVNNKDKEIKSIRDKMVMQDKLIANYERTGQMTPSGSADDRDKQDMKDTISSLQFHIQELNDDKDQVERERDHAQKDLDTANEKINELGMRLNEVQHKLHITESPPLPPELYCSRAGNCYHRLQCGHVNVQTCVKLRRCKDCCE
eukprot:Skav208830  [mRNA]  locus=scaffold667:539401:540705:+ [translate_table: standard]